MRKLDREALRQRLSRKLEAGEELLAWGWAVSGFRNVLIGASRCRLLLDHSKLNLETDRLEMIEFSRLEAIDAGRGDSSIPGWAKINLQNAIMDSVTTHLVIKLSGEEPRHYLFRPMPSVGDNCRAGLEIARVIAEACPGLPTEIDLKAWRRESGKGSAWLRWGLCGAVLLAAVLGLGAGHPVAAVAGAAAGFATGAVFAAGWNAITVSVRGRG